MTIMQVNLNLVFWLENTSTIPLECLDVENYNMNDSDCELLEKKTDHLSSEKYVFNSEDEGGITVPN